MTTEATIKTLYNIGLHYQTNPRQDIEHLVFQTVDYVLDEDKDFLIIYNQQDEIVARFAWSQVSMFTRDAVQVDVPETSAPQLSEDGFQKALSSTTRLHEEIELERMQHPNGYFQLYVDCYGDVQKGVNLEAQDWDWITLPKSSWEFYWAHGEEHSDGLEEALRGALQERLRFYHEREKIYGPSAWPQRSRY